MKPLLLALLLFVPAWGGDIEDSLLAADRAFDSATAVGFSVARPQATSSGRREKSTIQPSRM